MIRPRRSPRSVAVQHEPPPDVQIDKPFKRITAAVPVIPAKAGFSGCNSVLAFAGDRGTVRKILAFAVTPNGAKQSGPVGQLDWDCRVAALLAMTDSLPLSRLHCGFIRLLQGKSRIYTFHKNQTAPSRPPQVMSQSASRLPSRGNDLTASQMRQHGNIGLHVAQIEPLEFRQPRQRRQIADRRVGQIEISQAAKCRERTDVADPRAGQVQATQIAQSRQRRRIAALACRRDRAAPN